MSSVYNMSSIIQTPPLWSPLAVMAQGRSSQGIGPAGDPTGTAADRGTTTEDGNLTGREPSNQEVPTSEEPGAIAPDSRPVRDHGMLDGTRQGPAQPQ